MTSTRNPHVLAAEQFLRFAFKPGNLVEIRGLSSKGTARHLSTDLLALARSVQKINTSGCGIYYSLNAVSVVTKFAERNTTSKPLRKVRQTAGDTDLDCRCLYLVDVDPIRPPGSQSRLLSMSTREQAQRASPSAQLHSIGRRVAVWSSTTKA